MATPALGSERSVRSRPHPGFAAEALRRLDGLMSKVSWRRLYGFALLAGLVAVELSSHHLISSMVAIFHDAIMSDQVKPNLWFLCLVILKLMDRF